MLDRRACKMCYGPLSFEYEVCEHCIRHPVVDTTPTQGTYNAMMDPKYKEKMDWVKPYHRTEAQAKESADIKEMAGRVGVEFIPYETRKEEAERLHYDPNWEELMGEAPRRMEIKERTYGGDCTWDPTTHYKDVFGEVRSYAGSSNPWPSETKDTNPKDAVGIRKVPFSCMSGPVMAEVGLGMLEGACKYGRHNYRVIGVRCSVYFDAAQRHLWDFWEGQDIDPDSGIHHVSKLIADLMVLRDAMIRGNWVDDRPPKSANDWIVEANKKAGAVLDRYPNPVPAYTEAA